MYTLPAGGGTPTQITTFDNGDVHYPIWSADGTRMIFERIAANGDTFAARVPTATPHTSQTFYEGGGTRVRLPAYSPDAMVVAAGVRVQSGVYMTGTIDATVPETAPLHIFNYPEFSADYMYTRWSPDGTRMAIEARDPRNPQAKRLQLWARRRNISLPPHITRVGTQSVHDTTAVVAIDAQQGVSRADTITASDPESDPITYDAFFLGDGMSFNASTHILSWTPAAAVGTKFYVKFRVITASGETDAIIAQYTVTDAGTGWPFVDTRSASGWRVENSIRGRSLSGTLGVDAYRLKASPQVVDGRYQLRLRENEQEVTILDQVRLVFVDHDPVVRAWALGDHVVLGTRVTPYRVTTKAGTDITDLVNGSSGTYFVGEPGETLLVELTNQASGSIQGGEERDPGDHPFEIDPGCKDGCEGGEGLIAASLQLEGEQRVLDAAILNSTGILIQGRDAGGVWHTVRERYPREYFDQFLVDTLDQGPVRLVFVGRHKLRYVGRVMPVGDAVVPQVLPLLGAHHSRLGDVRLAVLNSGGATSTLASGDTIVFDFAATPVPAGQIRDFFLVARGVYTSL